MMAERIIKNIKLENKVTGYYLLNYLRFSIPALDCLIHEITELNEMLRPDYKLLEYPATLVYCINDNKNLTVRTLYQLNRG